MWVAGINAATLSTLYPEVNLVLPPMPRKKAMPKRPREMRWSNQTKHGASR